MLPPNETGGNGQAAVGERVRYFTQGLALGRKDFIEKVFERNRPRMQVKRKVGARKPKPKFRDS